MEDNPKVLLDGRGHRQARRRLPHHRRPAEGLRRGPRHRLAARRVGASSAPRSASRSAATARRRDPVRRLRLPGVRPDRLPGRQAAQALRRRATRWRWSIRIPFQGGIGAIEHHSESPEAYFAHTAGLRVVSPLDAQRRLLDDPPVDRARRPDHLPASPSAATGRRARSTSTRPPSGLFDAVVRREGTDVTLVAYGAEVKTCLARRRGRGRPRAVASRSSTLRSISPLDVDTVAASVEKTGRAASSSTRRRDTASDGRGDRRAR